MLRYIQSINMTLFILYQYVDQYPVSVDTIESRFTGSFVLCHRHSVPRGFLCISMRMRLLGEQTWFHILDIIQYIILNAATSSSSSSALSSTRSTHVDAVAFQSHLHSPDLDFWPHVCHFATHMHTHIRGDMCRRASLNYSCAECGCVRRMWYHVW